MRFLGPVLLSLIGLSIAVSIALAFPKGYHLQDFGAFVGSGQAANRGLDPYGIYYSLPDDPSIGSNTPNLNPPLSVVAFQALALLDPLAARDGWLIACVALYGLTLYLLHREYSPGLLKMAWAVALLGFWYTIQQAQVYTLLALVGAGAWLLLRRGRYLQAGLLIGLLLAIKPNFAVWPALLMLGGHWTVALIACVAATLLSALPLAAYGPGIYAQWLSAVATSGGGGAALPHNGSLFGLAHQLGHPELGLPLAATLLVGLALWVLLRRPDALAVSRLAAIVAFLAGPVSWPGYTLLLLPVFMERRWTWPLVAAAVVLALPIGVGVLYSAALLSLLPVMAQPTASRNAAHAPVNGPSATRR